VQKKILTTREIGLLIPQWPELVDTKLNRISRKTISRRSKFVPGERVEVMGVIPIIIDPDGYILNGKHRAYWATKRGLNLEAYVVTDAHDIIHHTPDNAYGENGLSGVLDAYAGRDQYISICRNRGIYSINDFL